jgi:hypothetical protein
VTTGVLAAILDADRAEQRLLSRLTSHPLLREAGALSHEQLIEVLLQRRFISMIFTPIYDMGIDALSMAAALQVAREIVREEYPDGKPSHREDLVVDLLALGATRRQILGCRPTATTTATLIETFELMSEAGAAGDDIGVLGILRFWGEVVVAVEYEQFWKAIRPHFLTSTRPSRFYEAHYTHDGCEPLATASLKTHSGRLGVCLRELLISHSTTDALANVQTRVIESRLRFYDQFRGAAGQPSNGRRAPVGNAEPAS